MYRKHFLLIILFISSYFLNLIPLPAQEEQGEIITISERVGKEINQEESDKFKLFEGINGFQSAVYIKLPDGKYFLKITYRDDKTGEIKISRTLQSETSIKNRGDYIDRFEEIQAEKHQYQNLLKPQMVSSDSGEIQAHQDTVYQEPGTALFWEVFGKPFGSLNMDLRINKSSRFSLGIVFYLLIAGSEGFSHFSGWSEYEEGEDKDVSELMPNIMYYYLAGEKNHRFEIGGGFSIRPVWHKDINGDFPLAFHGVIGYRYQKKKGLLFRAGFTPSYWPDAGFAPWPWIAMSFGFSL